MDKKRCSVCNHEYETFRLRMTPDSHYDYQEYYPCPVCHYNPEIDKAVHFALNNIEFLSQVRDGELKIKVLTGNLENIILGIIKKEWPNPSKTELKGGEK